MQFIADNGASIFLDSDFKAYKQIPADLTVVVYFELLEQLKLPCQSLSYNKKYSQSLFLRNLPELEEMDVYSFKQLEFSSIISPLRLYTYYILEQLLGNKTAYSDIGLLRLRKNQLVFNLKSFDSAAFEECRFERNWLSDYVVKRISKKDLMQTTDAFFILLNEKFKAKLLNSITYFQSETGMKVNKNEFVEYLFLPDRLEALATFVKRQF